MKQRKFFHKKSDLWFIFILVAAALALALVLTPHASSAGYALIKVDGQTVRVLALSHAGDQTFSLEEEYGVPVSFEVRQRRIRFVEVDCPDHLCEKSGFISKIGESAVCLPNRVVLTIQETAD